MAEYEAPLIAAPLGNVATERVILRRFEQNDLDGLAAVFASPEVWEFPYGRAFSRDETSTFLEAQVAEWDQRGFGCWIAIDKLTDRPIGYVGLSVPTFLPEILSRGRSGMALPPGLLGPRPRNRVRICSPDRGLQHHATG